MAISVGLMAKEFDLLGAGLLPLAGDMDFSAPRRATRTATLDGGATMNDGGFTVADTTVSLRVKRTLAAETLIRRLQQYHNRVLLSCTHGCFECGGMDVQWQSAEIRVGLLPLTGTRLV